MMRSIGRPASPMSDVAVVEESVFVEQHGGGHAGGGNSNCRGDDTVDAVGAPIGVDLDVVPMRCETLSIAVGHR